MSESDDAVRVAEARVQLTDGDVAVRAAAARVLARLGAWDDLDQLVALAKDDNSPSVRLYTAAAAADIVSRLRGGGGRPRMTADQVEQVHTWVKTFDPGSNPSLLMMLSAVADQTAIDRLVRMMRDPRNGVRAGACTALRRMALASASAGDQRLDVAVHKALGTRRMAADVLAELARLVGDVGMEDAEEALGFASAAGGPAAAAAELARERLAARRRPETWEGLWCSDGTEVLEDTGTHGRIVGWMIVGAGEVVFGGGERATFGLHRVQARIAEGRARLVWVPRPGESNLYVAIQVAGQTYYGFEGKELAAAVEEIVEQLTPDPAVAAAVADRLRGVDGPTAGKARATLLLEAGRPAEAADLLDELTSAKKPRPELFWLLARARRSLGDAARAKIAAQTYLEQCGKRGAHREAAEALLAGT